MGEQLADRAFRLIDENGWDNHVQFSTLNASWASIAPSLAVFVAE